MTSYEDIARQRLNIPKEGTNEPENDRDPAFGVICGVLCGLALWTWALFAIWWWIATP